VAAAHRIAPTFPRRTPRNPGRNLRLLACSALADWKRGHRRVPVAPTRCGAAALLDSTHFPGPGPFPNAGANPNTCASLPHVLGVLDVRYNQGPCLVPLDHPGSQHQHQRQKERQKPEGQKSALTSKGGKCNSGDDAPPGAPTMWLTFPHGVGVGQGDEGGSSMGTGGGVSAGSGSGCGGGDGGDASVGTGAGACGMCGLGRVAVLSPHFESTAAAEGSLDRDFSPPLRPPAGVRGGIGGVGGAGVFPVPPMSAELRRVVRAAAVWAAGGE